MAADTSGPKDDGDHHHDHPPSRHHHRLGHHNSVHHGDHHASTLAFDWQSQYMAADTSESEENFGVVQKTFKAFMNVCIVANAVQLGVCVGNEDCFVLEAIFTVIFTVEMVVKLVQHRSGYFRSTWNWLDFGLVWAAILDLAVKAFNGDCDHCRTLVLLRIVRILRTLRLFRVLRCKRELVIIAEGLMSSLKSMVWVAVLLALLIYAFGIFAVTVFGEATETIGWDTPFFDTLPRACLTLFNIAISAEWPEIVRPVLETYPLGVLFFVFYVFVATLGILNLIIGTIAEGTARSAANYEMAIGEEERHQRMQKIIEAANAFFAHCDTNKDGKLDSLDVFEHQGEAVQNLMREINLPLGFDIRDLYLLVSPSHEITKADFVLAMNRIVFCDEFERDCLFQYAINDLRRQNAEQSQTLVEVNRTLCAELTHTRVTLLDEIRRCRNDNALRGAAPAPVERSAAQRGSPQLSQLSAAHSSTHPRQEQLNDILVEALRVEDDKFQAYLAEARQELFQRVRAFESNRVDKNCVVPATISTAPRSAPVFPVQLNQVQWNQFCSENNKGHKEAERFSSASFNGGLTSIHPEDKEGFCTLSAFASLRVAIDRVREDNKDMAGRIDTLGLTESTFITDSRPDGQNVRSDCTSHSQDLPSSDIASETSLPEETAAPQPGATSWQSDRQASNIEGSQPTTQQLQL